MPTLGSAELWYDPTTGYGLKDQIRKGLVAIRRQFTTQIHLMEHEKSRTLAAACLDASEHFIACLSEYISSVYDELKTGGYDEKKAWKLTCTLVRRIFEQLYNVQVSAKDAQSYDGVGGVTTALVVYATLKAHDVMREFVDASFENHPSIASEYVKFLTKNSQANSVGTIVADVDKLSTKLSLLESTKSLLKKSVDSLQTRVTALERPKK